MDEPTHITNSKNSRSSLDFASSMGQLSVNLLFLPIEDRDDKIFFHLTTGLR